MSIYVCTPSEDKGPDKQKDLYKIKLTQHTEYCSGPGMKRGKERYRKRLKRKTEKIVR